MLLMLDKKSTIAQVTFSTPLVNAYTHTGARQYNWFSGVDTQ